MRPNPSRIAPLHRPGEFRLSRALRLRPEEYRTVLAEGRALAGRYFVIRHAPDPASAEARFGLIAGRRSFRRAVDRNRARRRIRETFRQGRNRIVPGHRIVIIARRAILNASVTALEQEFLLLCKRAGLRKGEDV